MAQLEHIEVIEKRFWSAVEMLWVNSNYARSAILLIPLQVLQEQFNVFMTSVLNQMAALIRQNTHIAQTRVPSTALDEWSVACVNIYSSIVVFMATIRASMLLEAV